MPALLFPDLAIVVGVIVALVVVWRSIRGLENLNQAMHRMKQQEAE